MRRWFAAVCALAFVAAFSANARAGGDEALRAALDSGNFSAVEQMARGGVVRFYMYSGFAHENGWVDGFAAQHLKRRYAVSLRRVPMNVSVFMNKLLAEKAAGVKEGSIDLLWINGENFKNAMKAGLLFGPFANRLPNFALADPQLAAYDFGYPVNGYEAPYGKAQFVFEYDQARTPSPPKNLQELTEWIKANPGQFTYPQPPDSTGSAFVRQAFYALTGGYRQYMAGFDRKLFDRNAPKLWAWLNGIKPYLWRAGGAYPRDAARLDAMFSRGEVGMSMSRHPLHAQMKILEGVYPKSVRTFALQDGSIFNTHFTAIPANSPNKAAALVVANFLMSLDAQLSKYDPDNWGDFPVLDLSKLSEDWREKFGAVDLGAATLPAGALQQAAVPEIPSAWLEALEGGWERNVLNR
ncbi:MAG: putative spermidine/putrescine transport system substrate-binding protein [Desulfovibrionales bacterium]|nr:putative spermidine/putrescine transport system substrate-binding protein [Desulfovibrionales bacterium]